MDDDVNYPVGLIKKEGRSGYLFDLFFNAAYSQFLTDSSKEELRGNCEKRLEDIVTGLEKIDSTKLLLSKLQKRVDSHTTYKRSSLFSIDFANHGKNKGKVDCVGYATVFLSALERLDRQDILKDIKAEFDRSHIWLAYHDNGIKRYINRGNHKAIYSFPLEAVLLNNLERRAFDTLTRALPNLLEEKRLPDALNSMTDVLKAYSGVTNMLISTPQVFNNISVIMETFGVYKEDSNLIELSLNNIEAALKLDPNNKKYVDRKKMLLELLNKYR